MCANNRAVINFNMRWSNLSDSLPLRQMFKRMIERAKQSARQRNTLHRFLFLNHAFEDEDVFAGYGDENLRRLHEVRQAVDPEGVFQRLMPGYFKLGVSVDSVHDSTLARGGEENPVARTEL